MNMMQTVLRLLFAILLQYPGDVTGQFTAAPPTCPGDTFTFTCTVTGDMNEVTIWRVGGGSSECSLVHSTVSAPGPCGSGSPFTVTTGAGFGTTSATSFTSTLSGTATTALNGTLVECFGPGLARDAGNRVGNSRLQTVGPPSVPTLSCVELSEDSGAVNVTMSWTLSGGDSADFYLISITTNAPQAPYGGLLNITIGSVTQHEMTGFMGDYEHTITVRGVNCGSQEGRESEPLTITPQVPAAPRGCTINLSYNESTGRLLFIETMWDSVLDTVNPCIGLSGKITQYHISFQAMFSESVNVAECTAGKCSHTFEPPSNPLSSYDSVSVAAENVVGVGAASTCTTQPISTTNNILTIQIMGVSSPSDAQLQCIFLSGLTGSARCTVQYGTDPTYMNLPYSAESTETGTAGNTVSVVLKERLNSSTVYYYTVSAVSGDVTVTVQGTFTTPEYRCSRVQLWILSSRSLTDVRSLNTSTAQYPTCVNDSVGSIALVNTTLNTATVAYYTGITPGSRACLVCDKSSGYAPSIAVTERVCQSDGTWSGSPIICECRQPQWNIALIVVGAMTLVPAIMGATVALLHEICIIYKKHGKKYWWWTAVNVVDAILLLSGVALWIAVIVVVSNPPNGNACDPKWRNTRDGLIGSGFAASILVVIFSSSVVLFHICWHINEIKKWWLYVLLAIATVLCLTGVGIWIALAVLCYIHPRGQNEIQPGSDESEKQVEPEDAENEEAAGLSVEEASKQSVQKKVSPGLMYAEVGSRVPPAAVMPPTIDDNVQYTSLVQTAKAPGDGDTLLSFKLLEGRELHQNGRDAPPPRPPKTNQEDTNLPPRPPKTHQQTAGSYNFK